MACYRDRFTFMCSIVQYVRRRLTVDYLWVLFEGDEVNVGLDVSFNKRDWKGIREKAGQVRKLTRLPFEFLMGVFLIFF
jgi:hypothetical protein